MSASFSPELSVSNFGWDVQDPAVRYVQSLLA